MRSINEINLKKELSNSDLIRILNFCETEFGYYGDYEFNNTEGLMEIINSYEFDIRQVVDLLYKNKSIKSDDDFLYFSPNGLISENRKDNINSYINIILHNISNGELREILQDCLQEDIYFE